MLQPATQKTSELYEMFKSALKTGDKQQLQAVLDQLDIGQMLDKGSRQAGINFRIADSPLSLSHPSAYIFGYR